MLSLEEMVRAVLCHISEILGDGHEAAVLRCGEEQIEFGTVDAEHVHLLMMEAHRADELVRREELSPLVSQAGVCGECFILGKPRSERARIDRETVAFFEECGGLGGGTSTVVEGKSAQDDLERIRLAFGALRREDACAGVAVPELDSLEFFCSLPFLDNVGARAVGAALGCGADDGGASVCDGAHLGLI